MFLLSKEAIEIEPLRRLFADARAGAVATFEGRVRNHNDGRPVLGLDYEAYEALAVEEAETIMKEATDRFGLYKACCVHRVGSLRVGDLAVWVGVSGAHRAEAFAACQYIIDAVKHRLPIWKRERYADGSVEWVNCQSGSRELSREHAH